MPDGTTHRFRIVTALSILAMMMGGLWVQGVAAAGSGSDQQSFLTAQAGESFDFLQINITDSDGEAISFPAGQEICLNVLIDGSSPLPSPCYASLPGQTLHAGREASPFLRSSSYSLAVASNTTGCDVTVPAMLPQDFGESGWYAIFNVTVACADVPLPTIVIPSPTTVFPLPTIVLPTPTPTIDSTTPTTAPIIEGYERVTLRIVPAIPGVTSAILPGEVCARLVVNPPLTGAALADHCHTRSTAIHDYFPTEGTSFPMASLYSANTLPILVKRLKLM